jgi:hypothetical protein
MTSYIIIDGKLDWRPRIIQISKSVISKQITADTINGTFFKKVAVMVVGAHRSARGRYELRRELPRSRSMGVAWPVRPEGLLQE